MQLRQQVQTLRRCRTTCSQFYLRAISIRNYPCFWCSLNETREMSAVLMSPVLVSMPAPAFLRILCKIR